MTIDLKQLRLIADDAGLTPHEAAVLGIMMSEDRWMQAWEIGIRIKGSIASAGCVKVHICRIRQKLRGHALRTGASAPETIESKYGGGYRLSDQSRTRLSNWTKGRPLDGEHVHQDGDLSRAPSVLAELPAHNLPPRRASVRMRITDREGQPRLPEVHSVRA